jgi:sec-independent protein translocase protein TatA
MLENLFTPTHLIVLFGVAMLFFGGKKIPELGRGFGEGLRGFRDAIKGIAKEDAPVAGTQSPLNSSISTE